VRGEVVVLGTRGGVRGFNECFAEPLRAVAGPSRVVLAGRLVVAGTHSGPRREMPGGREPSHVGTDLGEEHFRGSSVNAGDRSQQLDLVDERGEQLVDRCGERSMASSR